MASLIEDLIETLEKENEIYERMIPLAEKKTQIIVANDLEALTAITEQEQQTIESIGAWERKRQEVIINIGTVMNRNPSTLNFKTLIKMLEGRREEQDRLRDLHDKMKRTISRLTDINGKNKLLIQQSLEMIEFNMNFIQSTWRSPGVGQYGRSASEIDVPVLRTGMFDAKQ